MKKYVITVGILLGGLFLMNGGGMIIGMAFDHVVAFFYQGHSFDCFWINWHWGLVAIGWTTINRLCRRFNGTWCDFVAIFFILNTKKDRPHTLKRMEPMIP